MTRCETVLQPGRNCSIRIEKIKSSRSKSRKASGVFQNEIVYTCNFCSHRNSTKGTPKGHVKDLSAARSVLLDSSSAEKTENDPNSRGSSTNLPPVDCPPTPSGVVDFRSLAKSNKETILPETEGSVPNKRRKRKWSTVKEIATSSEREREQRFSNLAIPFRM